VDGGVHDNQGVASLLEQGCTVLLVSDASGQMDDQDQPSNGLLGVPLRANSILQARVREAQFRDLDARRRAGLLRGLMFIHLKQGLDSEPVDWIDCQDPSEPRPVSPLLPYGIQRGIQRRLAAIRTDLDSFSEAEAYALMSSGYSMAEHVLRGSVLGFPVEGLPRLEWEFRKIEPLMSQPGEDSALSRQLRVSDQLFLRAWRLVPGLTVAGGAGLGLLAILIAALAWRFWSVELVSLTVGGVVTWAGGIVLSVMGLKWLLQVVRAQKTLQQILLGIGMTLAGALLARLHLHVFDRKFLTQARLSRLLTRK
jgi:hypothetical protein